MPPRIGVRIEILRVPGERLHALGYRSALLPLRTQQRIHARIELFHLIEPKGVHLVGGHIGGRAKAQGNLIKRLTLRQSPDARIVRCRGAQLGERAHLPVERRIDLGADDARGFRAVVGGEAELLRTLPDRGGEDRVRGRGAAQDSHLIARAIDEEIGRHDLEPCIVPHPLRFLVEHRRKGP